MELWVPFLVAVIAALPGVLAYWNTRKSVTVEEKAQVATERAAEIKIAVEGMADLVDDLRVQLDRERDDCFQRITQAEADCKQRIDRVCEELKRRLATQARRIQELERQVGDEATG